MNGSSAVMELFLSEARAVGVREALEACGVSYKPRGTLRGGEHVGPCPVCGGRDRFSVKASDNFWNCRKCEKGGADGISLYRHCAGVGFLDACEALTGRERPGKTEDERASSAAERQRADDRIRALRAAAEARRRRDEEVARRYRHAEWQRCIAIWRAGVGFAGSDAERYLDARGLDASRIDGAYVRCHPDLAYFGTVEDGQPKELHRGPAMLVLFARPVSDRYMPIGIHRTWIDLAAAPKFRPVILAPDNEGLPTKKMRGSKAGGILPLIGRLSAARRMVSGEGIETVLGYAARDGFRSDTFYCAAGDLGNLCGRATRESRLRHPSAVRKDRLGRGRPVFVPGDVPDMDSEALPVPDHIDELILLGDGDSDPFTTRTAMVRGAARHAREGRVVEVHMAQPGTDFAEEAA